MPPTFLAVVFPWLATFVVLVMVLGGWEARVRRKFALVGFLGLIFAVTGIAPFLGAPLLVVTFVSMVAVAVFVGAHPFRTPAIITACLAVAIETWLLIASDRYVHYWDGLELSPDLSQADLVGTWKHGAETISLSADGTYSEMDGRHGHWGVQSMGWLVTDERTWAIARHQGVVVLLKIPDQDPDDWSKGNAFLRQP